MRPQNVCLDSLSHTESLPPCRGCTARRGGWRSTSLIPSPHHLLPHLPPNRRGSTPIPKPSPNPITHAASSLSCSPGRHYYVAVDRLQFKMETLLDLLDLAGRRPSLPIVLCCSSRDELDAVCSAVSNLTFISLSPLYSDLAEAERALILEKFRQSTAEWNQNANSHPGDDLETGKTAQKSRMIVVTDACLPFIASGEAPILAHVLINYELPTKKETYLRRMSTCLAADGIVINMVVGGEVVALKSIEENSGLVFAEMPISISDIL